MTGIVTLRNIEFQARHGATAAERKQLRRFQVDVEIVADLGPAIASDRLKDAVDYHALSALVVEIGAGRTWHLIESVAGAILSAIVERHPQAEITVEVRKLNPPCPGDPTYAAVTVSHASS